jgi:hypothetical protein
MKTTTAKTGQQRAMEHFHKRWSEMLERKSFSEMLTNGFLGGQDENEEDIGVKNLADNKYSEERDQEFYRVWHGLEALSEDPGMPADLKAKLNSLVTDIEAAYNASIGATAEAMFDVLVGFFLARRLTNLFGDFGQK